jgi:hypothetical protein
MAESDLPVRGVSDARVSFRRRTGGGARRCGSGRCITEVSQRDPSNRCEPGFAPLTQRLRDNVDRSHTWPRSDGQNQARNKECDRRQLDLPVALPQLICY